VAIDPAPFRGVLPLPFSALKSTVAGAFTTPPTAKRAIPLTFERSVSRSANAVSGDEAKELYATFAVPAAGAPLVPGRGGQLNP